MQYLPINNGSRRLTKAGGIWSSPLLLSDLFWIWTNGQTNRHENRLDFLFMACVAKTVWVALYIAAQNKRVLAK